MWLTVLDPRASILAFYNIAFGLGNCIAVIPYPVPALIADKLGRKWNVIIGSIISLIGVALQAASQDGLVVLRGVLTSYLWCSSRNVCGISLYHWLRCPNCQFILT